MKIPTKFLAFAPMAATLALVACGGGDLSTEDAHDTAHRCKAGSSGACLDDSQKRTIAFPNHFANVATSCDGFGHRIWETTRKQTFIFPDPTCPGFVKGQEPTVIMQAGQ